MKMKKAPINSIKGKKRENLDLDLVKDLIEQKKRYEAYFAKKPEGEIDNAAQSAYMGIIKTLHDISKKLSESKSASPGEMKKIAKEILENEYGVRRGS